MAACFKYVIETNDVTLDVCIWICNTVADSCLSSKVDNNCNVILCEELIDSFLIGNRIMDECPITSYSLYLAQALVFNVDVIVIGNGINTNDMNAIIFTQEALSKIATDKTSCTCYQYGLSVKFYSLHILIFMENVSCINL